MPFEPGNEVGVQFKPGISGNPDGRPTGSISLGTLINKILDGQTELNLDEDLEVTQRKPIKLTRREKIWLKIIMDAEDNEDPAMRLRAAMALADRTDGKPVAPVQLNGKLKIDQPANPASPEQTAAILKVLNET